MDFRYLLLLGTVAVLATATSAVAQTRAYNIPTGDAAASLQAFARQSGKQVLFPFDAVQGRLAPAIIGRFDDADVLGRLAQAAGLEVVTIDARTVTLRRATVTPSAGREAAATESVTQLDEIVVVGSHIRGVGNGASPVIQFDNRMIAQSGAATLQQFFDKLPQNFGGGANAGNNANSGVDRDVGSNWGAGSSLNLRGLGTGTTLTLLNGRRLTASNQFQYVDISLIPVSAVERIEVLTDGASALYGSDAIGGVVNIVLRKDFEGYETRLRYGGATSGGLEEFQAVQTGGWNWSSGQALLSYEFLSQDNLDVSERRFSRNAPFQPYDLYPETERHSLYGAISQTISPNLSLELNGLYAKRDVRSVRATASDYQIGAPSTEQYDFSGALTYDFSESWQARLSGAVGHSDVERTGFSTTPTGVVSPASSFSIVSDSRYVDLAADGPVYALPGGEIRVALGATYRSEEYRNRFTAGARPQPTVSGARDVASVFGEAIVPLVGPNNRFAGAERLEATIAARYDRYSDFGSTLNPKLGLLWEAVPGVLFRGTYGTSFRAPIFEDLQSQNAVVVVVNLPNAAAPMGRTNLMLLQGGNPDLDAEKATTWTGGVEFKPTFIEGLSLGLNYYRISYTDRIDRGFPGNFTTLFAGDTAPYAPILTYDPSLDLITRFRDMGLAGAQYALTRVGPFAVPADQDESDVEVILDNRLRNNAATFQDGLDFNIGYEFDAGPNRVGLTAAGQYILSGTRKVIETSPEADALNQAFLPVDFKARAGATLARGDWSAAAFFNYVDGYSDLGNAADPSVEAWKTVDLDIRYGAPPEAASYLRGVSVALSVQNLFNEDPPFVLTPSGSGFDPTNANPLGRFISFTVTKQW